MKPTITLLTTLLLTSTALPQSLTTPIKPFVNESTLLIARVNVAAIDFDSLDRWSADLTQQLAPADRRNEISAQLHSSLDSAKKFSQQFIRAGGKTAWAVLSLENLSRPNPFFFVVPLEPGVDAQSLKTALSVPHATVEQIGAALVVSQDSEAAARLKDLKPKDRPDLFKATDAADPTADLIVAAAASADAKKVLQSMLPELPDKQPATPLTRDLAWASASVKSSARTGKIIFNTPDPQRLHDVLVSLLPEGVQAQDPLPTTLRQLLRQSKVEKDQLVIDLQPDSTTQLAARTAEGIARARQRALRIQSMNNIKQLLLGLIIAANNDKTGQYPPNLEDALKNIDGGDKTLINPGNPAEQIGYVYVRPPDGLKADSQRLVIYEKFTDWQGVSVGFADGHVEFISDKAQFQKLLDTAKSKQTPSPNK